MLFVSSCSQIAKDMERWAKNVNAAKATQQQQLQALIQLEREDAQTKVITAPVGTGDSASDLRRTGIALSAALEVRPFPVQRNLVD